MADISIAAAADQSGLSDLSAASISSVGPTFGPLPVHDDHAYHAELNSSRTALTAPATPLPSQYSARLNSTAGPSRAGWTPSPEASSSTSRASKLRRSTSPRSMIREGNESLGSSLGTFDYSNASFSESFLRRAGADMLAGLDEATSPQTGSGGSSPRYRTSSSPTVTARPIKPVDPRTPFTGKSLRTRMLEAGVLDSPASSEGSSPVSSPTARLHKGTYAAGEMQVDQTAQENQDLRSPDSERFEAQQALLPEKGLYGGFDSPKPWRAGLVSNGLDTSEQGDWQEGLSMVPEESYVEDASQMFSLPIVSSRPSPLPSLPSSSSESVLPTTDSVTTPPTAPEPDAPQEVSTPTSDHSLPPNWSFEAEPSPASDSPASCSSPTKPSSAPSTPAPRAVNTPRSFARLRMVTPARSSPLSRVVNFSPSSTGSSPKWMSPASQRSETPAREEVSSPALKSDSGESEQQHELRTPGKVEPTGTPSRMFSPTPSSSFATPASERAQGSWESAPAMPVVVESLAAREQFTTPEEAPFSPAVAFGTPQWSPAPSPEVDPTAVEEQEGKPQQESILHSAHEDEDPPYSSSSCSSASSGQKEGGDLSTSSQADFKAAVSHEHNEEHKQDILPEQNSPSATRLSRLQLTRLTSPLTLDPTSAPEISAIGTAFDTLTSLSEDRCTRLLAQLQASTAHIESLETALEASAQQAADLEDLRYTLSQLSTRYDSLVSEADGKDAEMQQLVLKFQEKALRRSEGGEGRLKQLEEQLEEEGRCREVERRDFEVRIQGLMKLSSREASPALDLENHDGGAETRMEQLRASLEKDFEVRRSMEHRELMDRIVELEGRLASTHVEGEGVRVKELEKQVEELTEELDRRFEEATELKEDLEEAVAAKDLAEDRVAALEEELDEARSSRDTSTNHSNHSEELVAQVHALQATLSERDASISNLNSTLSLTRTQLDHLTIERDTLLTSQIESTARIAALESHILSLETQLRTPLTPTSAPSRVQELERSLAHSNIELLKLRKANEALQEDNVTFSIALSAKQLELGMVKRNARFALKNANLARGPVEGTNLGLPVSRPMETEVKFPNAPQTELMQKREEGKENTQAVQQEKVNNARLHARQMLAQRKALSANAEPQNRRQRLALAA